jgi:uncharacterized protein involved in outer membrane biogenesis
VLVLIAELWLDDLIAKPARRLIERELSAATGLEARIQGSFDLDFVPELRFEVTQLVLTRDGQSEPTVTIEDVELDLDLWLLVTGAVAIDEIQLLGTQLNLRLVGDTSAIDVESLVAPPDDGAEVKIDFRIKRIMLEDFRIEYNDSASGATRVIVVDELSLAADAPELAISLFLTGSFEESPFTIQGEIGATTELLRPTAPYPVSLQAWLPDAKVEVEVVGHLTQPTRLRGMDVEVSIVVPELSAILPAPDGTLPPLGPIRITGHVRDQNGALAVENLKAETLGDAHVTLTATGSIRDLQALRNVEFDTRLSANGLDLIQPFVDLPLPEFDSIEVDAHVSDLDDSLGVQGQLRASGADGGLSVELSGSDGNLRNFEEIDIGFDIQARDLALLGKTLALERPLPPIGPVSARGRLRGHEGALGFEELVVRVGDRDATWLELDGSLKDLANLADIHLVARFGTADIRHMQSLLEHELPDVGALRGNATLSDRDGRLGIEDLRVTGGSPGKFTIDLSGGIDDLREIDEVSFDTEIEAASLETLGALLGFEWPAIGPVSFSGHLTGSDEKTSARGNLRLVESEFIGTGSVAYVAGMRPSIHVQIQSPHIDLRQIGLSLPASPSEPEAAADAEKRNWWSGNEPLPFERLRSIDANIELRADRITGEEGLEVLGIDASLQLDDGHLVIREAGADYEGGSLRTELRIDARTPDPALTLRLEADDVNLDKVLQALKEDTRPTGFLDASIALESRGHSPAELRSNLEGTFRAVLRDGIVASKFGDAFVNKVLRLSLPALLSSGRTGFGCIVAEFEIEEGVAVAQTLVIDAKKVVVTGSGEIDLGANAFDLVLSPKARDPEVLNLSAEVEVTGPLEKPVIRARRLSIPIRLARGLLANVLAPFELALGPLRGQAKQLCQEGLTPPTQSANDD